GVERRARGRAGDPRGIAVEEHRDLLARRILELLHHQRTTACGGGPVDAPQRLPLLVVADAVDLEADGPPQQEPAPVLGAGAAVEENPLEVDQPWVDDERLLLVERKCGLRETERIGEGQLHRCEAVASARDVENEVGAGMAATAPGPELDRLLPQPARPVRR